MKHRRRKRDVDARKITVPKRCGTLQVEAVVQRPEFLAPQTSTAGDEAPADGQARASAIQERRAVEVEYVAPQPVPTAQGSMTPATQPAKDTSKIQSGPESTNSDQLKTKRRSHKRKRDIDSAPSRSPEDDNKL